MTDMQRKLPPHGENLGGVRERMLRGLHAESLHADPVESWKRAALMRVTRGRPGIELKVSVSFALVAIVSGVPFGSLGPALVSLGLFSVLAIQELPRAWLLRARGRPSMVHISPAGGDTENLGDGLNDFDRLQFAAIGSLANVAMAVALFALSRCGLPAATPAILRLLALWHGIWGLAQILPVVPFRAGAAVAARLRPPLRLTFGLLSTTLVLVSGLALAKVWPTLFPVLTLAMCGAVRALVEAHRASLDTVAGIPAIARRAEELIIAEEPIRALQLVRGALPRVRGQELRTRLWQTLAWGAIGSGDAFLAHSTLGTLPSSRLDVHLVAAYLSVCNRTEEAIELLESARAAGQRSRETTKLLLELLLRRGDVNRMQGLARDDADLLSEAELCGVRAALAAELGAPA